MPLRSYSRPPTTNRSVLGYRSMQLRSAHTATWNTSIRRPGLAWFHARMNASVLTREASCSR